VPCTGCVDDNSVADRDVRIALPNCVAEQAQGGATRSGLGWSLNPQTNGGIICIIAKPNDLVAGSTVRVGLTWQPYMVASPATLRFETTPILIPGGSAATPRDVIVTPVNLQLNYTEASFTAAQVFGAPGTTVYDSTIAFRMNPPNGYINIWSLDLVYRAAR
jgi:hypothetical protein